jgi:starch-binding outer membrane protein SusE/F
MKIIAKFLFTFFMAGSLLSCEKDVATITYEEGTPPVLTANRTTIPLTFLTASQEAVQLNWTNPDYKFSTGISSHDVNYLLEIDTVGANFSNPNRKVISMTKDLSIGFTQEVLNDYLLNQLVLVPGIPHNIEFRVTASLVNNSLPISSNILQYTVTPYAIPPKVNPPASGELYIVGSATPGDWTNPVPVPSQKFVQLSPMVYELTVQIIGGGSYLFLPVNGDWGDKYGGLGANNTNNVNGDDFKRGGGDLLAPATSGTYKIQVDFQRGKFTLTRL